MNGNAALVVLGAVAMWTSAIGSALAALIVVIYERVTGREMFPARERPQWLRRLFRLVRRK